MQKMESMEVKLIGMLHVIPMPSRLRQTRYHSSLTPFMKRAQTPNTGEENGLTSITLTFTFSRGKTFLSMLVVDSSP